MDIAGPREVADSERTKRWVGGGVCVSVQYTMDRLDTVEDALVTESCLLDVDDSSSMWFESQCALFGISQALLSCRNVPTFDNSEVHQASAAAGQPLCLRTLICYRMHPIVDISMPKT